MVGNLNITLDPQRNLRALEAELDWFELVLNQVIRSYFLQEGHEGDWRDIPMPAIDETSTYGAKIREWEVDQVERVALVLAMASNIRPQALDVFFGKNQLYDRPYTEFGGVVDRDVLGFIPTAQTLSFILSGANEIKKNDLWQLFDAEHILIREQVLELGNTGQHATIWAGSLGISKYWLNYFITGVKSKATIGVDFPAKIISTDLEWDDLVLEYQTFNQVDEILTWLRYDVKLLDEWGLRKKIKPGFRALFYGPPGTGKTLTASLLGKQTGKMVYRVDLSMIASKYIGETEKNLSRLFDVAESQNWILFFDEADSLFGQRTSTSNSNDRHANQQTGYLLQRIEDYPGVAILATNLKANMDDAFSRRFQSMIHFGIPSEEYRIRLWEKAFDGVCKLSADVDLTDIAREYKLAGGAIINVLRYCALAVIKHGRVEVSDELLKEGVKRELKKENRTLIR